MQRFANWIFCSVSPLPANSRAKPEYQARHLGRRSVSGDLMRYLYLTLAALSCLLPVSAAAVENRVQPQTISVDQIHAGMRGVAYTVFEGIKPEPMEVEVLGVLRNMNGPKGDVILVRLRGEKAEYTGVVAGMSGSPVYFDGKLAGALAFRIGQFSKEPIAGVTPIADMLQINALDKTAGPGVSVARSGSQSVTTKTSGGDVAGLPTQDVVNYLKPIDTPLVFNGFSEEAVKLFGPKF